MGKQVDCVSFSSIGKKKVLLLGSGELGKEVAIELMRLNAYVIACDRYFGAPAMQVAHEYRVLNMNDEQNLRSLIDEVKPDIIVPEIEAIATGALREYADSVQIVPSVNAVNLTMNREGIRRLAAEELNIETSKYIFASSLEELRGESENLRFPLVIKPIQSSSGKGQSIAKTVDNLEESWNMAIANSRGDSKKVIAEQFVDFDFEITLLTVRAKNGVVFLDPIGHEQIDGDYRTSWQPQTMSEEALKSAQLIADKVTDALTKDSKTPWGIFGVEFFVKGDSVIFSEVSPRPHDTGMVTMVSANESEFAMHAKAVLGFSVHQPAFKIPSASYALLAKGSGVPVAENVDQVLDDENIEIRVFGKPVVEGERRVGVLLCRGEDVSHAITEVQKSAEKLSYRFE